MFPWLFALPAVLCTYIAPLSLPSSLAHSWTPMPALCSHADHMGLRFPLSYWTWNRVSSINIHYTPLSCASVRSPVERWPLVCLH